MANSGSALFPFEEDFQNRSIKRAMNVGDVLRSAIRCFLITEPGQRRGNPIGSFVPGLLHQLIPPSKMPTFEEELKQELTQQFPGVTFLQTSMQQERTQQVNSLVISIKFSTPITDVQQLSVTLST